LLVCTFPFLLVSNFIRVYFKKYINIVGINNILLLLFHKPVGISLNHIISSKFKVQRLQTGKKKRKRERGAPFTFIYAFNGLLHRMERVASSDPRATVRT